jgi:DNA-binding SARP family transcriptional activator
VTHYLAATRPDEVAEWASRIIEVRPCDEAVRQYRRCELLLRAELGVQPSPDTTALLRTILRG